MTPQDLERLATLVKATGWKLLYGVNLKHKDAARAADEVAHAKRILGDGSALWLVDQAMLVASTGVTAENFHSNIAVCGGPKPPGSANTPFCAANAADQLEGKLMVQPEYYGMLLVREIGRGSFAPVENSDPATLRAYAVTDGNRTKLVLVNLADPAAAAGPRPVNVIWAASSRRRTSSS